MKIFISVCAIAACFLFASAFTSDAAKRFDEKKWLEFGVNCTLAACFYAGICFILRMVCGA